jgi:hypothetical protein
LGININCGTKFAITAQPPIAYQINAAHPGASLSAYRP